MIFLIHILRCIPLLTAAALSSGCSWDSAQRTSYETVESMRLQQCMDQLNADCQEERTSYDDYQSERERIEKRNP